MLFKKHNKIAAQWLKWKIGHPITGRLSPALPGPYCHRVLGRDTKPTLRPVP